MRPAKTIRRWALVENGKITNLIYTDRGWLSGDYIQNWSHRRIARVEIREVVRKKPRKRGRS